MEQFRGYRTRTLKTYKINNSEYEKVDQLCLVAKNIYNSVLYICKQDFFYRIEHRIPYSKGTYSPTAKKSTLYNKAENKVYQSESIKSLLLNIYEKDCRALPSIVVDSIVNKACQTFQAFIAAQLDYKKNPQKYTGKPKLPHYFKETNKKGSRFTCILPSTFNYVFYKDHQIFINYTYNKKLIANGRVKNAPLTLNPVKTNLDLSYGLYSTSKLDYNPLIQLQIVPKKFSKSHYNYELQLVYDLPTKIQVDSSFKNIGAIDLGIDNFAAFTVYSTQSSVRPLIINGKGLKSKNKFYNKEISYLKSIGAINNSNSNKFTFNKIRGIYAKRDRVFKDFYHKASRAIVDYALENKVSIIFIGYNKNWKSSSSLTKNPNQTFQQISYEKFKQYLSYKAESVGIKVREVNEAYSSGTSYLDNELPVTENYNKERRIYRGLFTTNTNKIINADINASYQIMVAGCKQYFKKYHCLYDPAIITKESLSPKVINIDTFKVNQHKTKIQNKQHFNAPVSQYRTDKQAAKVYNLAQQYEQLRISEQNKTYTEVLCI
jgi:IS605 OrfB family transposase